MKKIITIFISTITFMFSIIPINAIETDNYHISNIILMLQNINKTYHTQFHIYEKMNITKIN